VNCPLGRIHQPTLLASRFTSSDVKSCVKALQTDVARTVVNSFVISSIDYCNCLLAGAPQYQLNRLQAVMNSAGRLICGLNMFDRISRVLHDRLHWLPVPQRIQYKLCLLVYKALRGLAPRYLADFCQPVSSVSGRSGLRSSTHGHLVVVSTACDGFWTRFFCHVCTTGMEPAATRDQEQSVAGIFQVSH